MSKTLSLMQVNEIQTLKAVGLMDFSALSVFVKNSAGIYKPISIETATTNVGMGKPSATMKSFNKIDLSRGMFALIDDGDYHRVSEHSWYFNGRYAASCINGKQVQMHRFIMNPPDNMVVDHIDGHRLDNRKCNLRICTQQENLCNMRHRRGTSSEYKGVHFSKSHNKFISRITNTVDGKKTYTHIGYFESEEQAAYAFNVVSKSIRGKYAKLNDVMVSDEHHRIIFNPERIKRLEDNLGIKLNNSHKKEYEEILE